RSSDGGLRHDAGDGRHAGARRRVSGGAFAIRQHSAPGIDAAVAEALRRSRSRHEGVHAGRSAVVTARLRRYTRRLGGTSHRSSGVSRSRGGGSLSRTSDGGVCARSGGASLALVALVIAALLISRWNVRAKRADTRGAGRLSLFLLTGYVVCWVIAAHHVSDVNTELNFFIRNMGPVLFVTAVGWLMYTALEPYVRRFWPDGILGWTRLMSGYIRDPRVGRDVLIGCTIAVGLALLEALYHLLPPLFGRPSALPTFQSNVAVLAGGGTLVSTLFDQGLVSGIFQAMFGVLAYVLLRLAFRRTALAVIASV